MGETERAGGRIAWGEEEKGQLWPGCKYRSRWFVVLFTVKYKNWNISFKKGHKRYTDILPKKTIQIYS